MDQLFRLSRFLLFFLPFVSALAFLASPCLAASSVNVPLDSWVYEALERLEGYGLIDSALPGTKPYSRLEVARLIGEAVKKWEEEQTRKKLSGFAGKDLIPYLLERFKKEFNRDLIDMGVLEGSKSPSFLKPVDEIILKYVFQTDNPVVRPQNGQPPTRTIDSIYNNDGIVYQKHNNFSAEVEGEGRLWNHFSLYYQPIFKAFENGDVNVDLQKGYIKAEALKIELEVGRDSLWWGPGYNGGLLMTNNAKPFDMVKLSNSEPILFPWIFKYLGLFKFNLFWSKGDNEEPFVRHPLIYGLHLDFKPFPILEVGLSHVAVFAGEGTDLSLGDYFKVLYSNKNYSGNLESNQQISIDFSLRWPNMDKILPIARSLKLYGEWGAEDTGAPPDKRAYLFGLMLYDLFLTGRVDFRLEYTNTSPAGDPQVWYNHYSYPPIYHDRIFGHHAGSNAEDIFVRMTYYFSPKLLLGLDFDDQTQGYRDAPKTNSYQLGADLDYWITNRINVKGRYIFESFKDPNSIAGGNDYHHLFWLDFRYRF